MYTSYNEKKKVKINLEETVICYCWKGCFYMALSLNRLLTSTIFDVKTGFGMDTSHSIPENVLVVMPLIELWLVLWI